MQRDQVPYSSMLIFSLHENFCEYKVDSAYFRLFQMKEELEAEHEKTLDSTRETLTREHEENLQTLRSELQKDLELKQSQLEEQKTLQLAIEEEASSRLEERKKQLKEEHETAQVRDIHVACDIHVIYM